MKTLHQFILKSYIGPLATTFFISLFVLLLQILWKYIDVLVGKGLEFITLSELFVYAILQVTPMALPLSILLASLMTFGNLGENYELTAIKASGISLYQTMKPLLLLTALLSLLAFAFSDNIMPWANRKFYSLLYSIKLHQPELEIKEKVFNQLNTFSIKVDSKDRESGKLHDVMIYDHSNAKHPASNVTIADQGLIKMDEKNNMMRITLHNGIRYEENVSNTSSGLILKDKPHYQQDVFKKQISFIDMNDSEFTKIDEAAYASHNKMKNLNQLITDIEALQHQQSKLSKHISTNNHKKLPASVTIPSGNNSSYKAPTEVKQVINHMVLANAKRNAQEDLLTINKDIRQFNSLKAEEIAHQVELHRKFTLPFTCFIFFIIGSSLGAIIRKGGLGMPVVVAIAFFIVYYLIDTFGANMVHEEILPAYIGMWLASAILSIIAIFVGYQSANDSALLQTDNIKLAVNRWFRPIARTINH